MDFFEIAQWVLITLVIAYLAISRGNGFAHEMWVKYVDLSHRTETIEAQTRYVADQPQRFYSVGSAFYDEKKYEEEQRKNDVPITDVVKAIVKHLGMEIEKVEAKTVKTPQEVKVVEKGATGSVIMGATGTVVMPDGSGIPMPKPKRKRKTK